MYRPLHTLYPRHCLGATLLGASLLAAVTPANAGEIKLYGGADVGISYVNVSSNSQSGNHTSRLGLDSNVLDDTMIGFRGTETLSPNWSVGFNLASEFDLSSGELAYDTFFGIESTISLTRHGWGTLALGRQQTISTDFFTNIDPMGLSFGQSNMGTSFTAINTQIYDNLIQLTSATWSGFTAGIGYSFDTGDTGVYANSGVNKPVPSNNGFGNSNKMRALTAAVQYQSGPVLLAASYDRAYASSRIPASDTSNGNGLSQPNPQTTNPQAWYLGAAVTVDQVVLSAAWGRGINGALSGSGPGNDLDDSPLTSLTGDGGVLFSPGFNHDAYLLGFSWAVDSRTQLMASWQMLQPRGRLKEQGATGSQQILGSAITYKLSPRTTAYAWASYGDNFQLVSGAKTTVIGTGFQTLF